MNLGHFCIMTVVTWGVASACPAVTSTDAITQTPPAGVPFLRLATPPGFADDDGFFASTSSRVAELQQQAAEASDVAHKASLLLAAANLILAEQLEPASTRKFMFGRASILAPHQVQEADEGRAAAVALDQADALVSEAETLLHAVKAPPTGEDQTSEGQIKELNRIVVTLKAFAQALRVYLVDLSGLPPAAQREVDVASSRAARRAASTLSVMLEDDDPQIAAAAAFWQACLRAMESDPTPALDILDRAIVDLPADAPRFGFYSRMLRCRLVAARGSPAAALALLMQVEERVDNWFKADSDRTDAIRSCAWLRLQILEDWHNRLDPTSHAEERAWCQSRIESLRTERFSESSGATILRLNQAIPIIARPLDPAATPP